MLQYSANWLTYINLPSYIEGVEGLSLELNVLCPSLGCMLTKQRRDVVTSQSRNTCCIDCSSTIIFQVSKLHIIVKYSFLFPTVQKYKNRPRNGRVIVENKVTFFRHSVNKLHRQVMC